MKNFLLLGFCLLISGNGLADDKDIDGIPDHLDKCPNTKKVFKNDPNFKYLAAVLPENRSPKPQSVAVDKKGCALDYDEDGIADHADFCPENSALEISMGVYKNGCPKQSDADGTPDYRDLCPNTQRGVKTDANGCPVS